MVVLIKCGAVGGFGGVEFSRGIYTCIYTHDNIRMNSCTPPAPGDGHDGGGARLVGQEGALPEVVLLVGFDIDILIAVCCMRISLYYIYVGK